MQWERWKMLTIDGKYEGKKEATLKGRRRYENNIKVGVKTQTEVIWRRTASRNEVV